MNKQEMIDSAEKNYWLMRRKFEATEQEYLRCKEQFFAAERDLRNSRKSFEVGDFVLASIYENEHDPYGKNVSAKILDVYLCGAKYKILLNNNEVKEIELDFLSRVENE